MKQVTSFSTQPALPTQLKNWSWEGREAVFFLALLEEIYLFQQTTVIQVTPSLQKERVQMTPGTSETRKAAEWTVENSTVTLLE